MVKRIYDAPDHPDLEKPDPRTAIRNHPQDAPDPLKSLNAKIEAHEKRFEPRALRVHQQDLDRKPQSLLSAAAGMNSIPKEVVKEELISLARKQQRYQFYKAIQPVDDLIAKTEDEYNIEKSKKKPNLERKEALKTKYDQLVKMGKPIDEDQQKAERVFDRVEQEINQLVDSHYNKGRAAANINGLIHKAGQKIDQGCREVGKYYSQKMIRQSKEFITASNSKSYGEVNHDTGKTLAKSIKMFQQKSDIHFFEKRAKENVNTKLAEIKQSEIGKSVSADGPPTHSSPNMSRR